LIKHAATSAIPAHPHRRLVHASSASAVAAIATGSLVSTVTAKIAPGESPTTSPHQPDHPSSRARRLDAYAAIAMPARPNPSSAAGTALARPKLATHASQP
jgi:hypothetical protein